MKEEEVSVQNQAVESEGELDVLDKDFAKGLGFFKARENAKLNTGFAKRLDAKLMENLEAEKKTGKFNIFNARLFRPAFAGAVFVLVAVMSALFLPGLVNINRFTKPANQIAKTPGSTQAARFMHYQYLSKPSFAKALPSSFAAPDEYRIGKTLPSAGELLRRSKISLIKTAYAIGDTFLPVYRATRHEVSKTDALELARKFSLTTEPKLDGFAPPAYYGFIFEDDKNYLLVSGGSGSGSFEYYLKGPGLPGSAPSDNEAGNLAREFLKQKGLIDDSYFISGTLSNVSDISKRTGFREDHKQVYFRKKLQSYQVYDWITGGGSPITDRVEVWVGVNGRILYASDPGYWTAVDANNKTEYLLKEPNAVFEDIKAGKGKLGWIDYDAINVSSGGYGPHAPAGNFALYGRLRDVEIQSADLAYYHQQEGIENPEFYQPIYLFKAQATLDWKDDYKVDYEADKFIQGKRTTVTLLASAVADNYFFENPATLTQGQTTPVVPLPVYTPVIQPTQTPQPTIVQVVPTDKPEEKQSFILKLGVITPLDNPKRNVYLGWEEVPGAVKYNIYLKIGGSSEYSQVAIAGTGLSETIGVNKYFDYYFKVRACKTADRCIESNEVFLPQEQIPNFYMKLGVVTPKDDPKTEVVLSWSEFPGTVKYNVFLRNSPTEEYGAALTGTGELTYTATVNRHNNNYFMIQACNGESCYSSNELLLQKE